MTGTVPAHGVSVKASSLQKPGSPSPKLLLATRGLGIPETTLTAPAPHDILVCAPAHTQEVAL